MKYKLCILAAGSGKRMHPLTKSINKALLPVDSKAAISHVIEKHSPNIEIIIAVNYEKEKIRQYIEIAHPDRKICFVEVPKIDEKGSGPGFSLICCKEYLNMPFIFSTIDTLYPEACPMPNCNWMGISEVNDPSKFCTVNLEFNKMLINSFVDKSKNGTNLAFIGVAGIKDYEIFFSNLIKDNTQIEGEIQVSNGFKGLLNKGIKPMKFSWFDVGSIDGYYYANKNFSSNSIEFDFSKNNEYIYFVSNNVIKYFSEAKTVKNRVLRANLLKKLAPNIKHSTEFFYSYQMINGNVLYDQNDIKIVLDLLNWLNKFLWIKKELSLLNRKSFFNACHDFYYKKTLSRINNYYSRFECKDHPSCINEIQIDKVSNLLKKIDFSWLSKGIPSNFHGDLQFDNILLTDEKKFILLDWRQDFSGLINYGDMYYDLAKLNGGLYISYKNIKKNKFKISIDNKNVNLYSEKDDFLLDAKKIFDNFVLENNYDLKKIEIITGIIFLNMAPMHHAPFSHYVYYLGKKQLAKWISTEIVN